MMQNKEEIERECRERMAKYYEELRKHEEFLGQFVSVGWVDPGKPIESPKRVLDTASIKQIREAEQKLDKLRQEMDEASNPLYEAYH